MPSVKFSAIINKISTTIDGGWRVTLDVPDWNTDEMSELAKFRDQNLLVEVASTKLPKEVEQNT